jgi:uncharacterized RDD family membrane protein YckC
VLVPATWLSRVYAAAIDAAIVITLTVPTMTILVWSGEVNPPVYSERLSTQFVFMTAVVLTLFAFVYSTLWIAYRQGQTIGKRAIGIRVVKMDGTFLGLGHAAVREVLVKQLLFGFGASFSFGIIQLADALWPFVDRINRCLHDIVAQTRVVVVLEPA